MSLVFLTGMPGAGKSYWGKRMAEARGLPFIDMDEFIEQEENRTITEIFEMEGEREFRLIETAALNKIISENKVGIVACGGGTVIYEGNIDAMHAAGCIIYLKAEIATLAARLHDEAGRRPLLTQSPYLLPTLQQMLSAREAFYTQADHILQVENLTDATFAQIIETCINKR